MMISWLLGNLCFIATLTSDYSFINHVKRFNKNSVSVYAKVIKPDFDPSDTRITEANSDTLKKFQEYANNGLLLFKQRDIDGAIKSLRMAMSANSTQPLAQLGIFLYCNNQYEEAAKQLALDIRKIEASKQFKATDLRLWHSACLNRLNKTMEAIDVLDLRNIAVPDVYEQRLLMNYTLNFYGQQYPLEEMIDFIGNADQDDFTGRRFYGNFYLGLYFDSFNNFELSEAFLRYPYESRKYKQSDMWFHLPRVLYDMRFTKTQGDTINTS